MAQTRTKKAESIILVMSMSLLLVDWIASGNCRRLSATEARSNYGKQVQNRGCGVNPGCNQDCPVNTPTDSCATITDIGMCMNSTTDVHPVGVNQQDCSAIVAGSNCATQGQSPKSCTRYSSCSWDSLNQGCLTGTFTDCFTMPLACNSGPPGP